MIKDISSKELSEAIKVLAEFCKTPKEKGLFLLKLITYWDRYMDLVEYDTYVVPPMFPCRFWPCYSSRSLMLERARKCLINWKRDENAILDTVDDRGRSLLEVAIEHYEDPLKFSEKAASYDYDKEDLLGKKLIRYKRIRDIDECLIS